MLQLVETSTNKVVNIQTHRLIGGFMKYTVEVGSVAMICIPDFIKIGSGSQKKIEEDSQRHSMVIL
jgi:hypothetical protein